MQKTEKTTNKSVSTLIDPNKKEDIAVDKKMYQRLVGKLIYLSHTRMKSTRDSTPKTQEGWKTFNMDVPGYCSPTR